MNTRIVSEPGFAEQTSAFLDRLGPTQGISDYAALQAARAAPSEPAVSGSRDPAVPAVDLYLPLRGGPNADLPGVLTVIHGLLRPGGWLYLGVYRGNGDEGPIGQDRHEPARFFSFRTDEQIKRFARQHFTVFDFHVIAAGQMDFQSLTLRRD